MGFKAKDKKVPYANQVVKGEIPDVTVLKFLEDYTKKHLPSDPGWRKDWHTRIVKAFSGKLKNKKLRDVTLQDINELFPIPESSLRNIRAHFRHALEKSIDNFSRGAMPEGTTNNKNVLRIKHFIVPTEEALELLISGRHSELLAQIRQELLKLPKEQSFSFQITPEKPEDLKSEVTSVENSLKKMLKERKMPWLVRYIKSKNLILIMRESDLRKEK